MAKQALKSGDWVRLPSDRIVAICEINDDSPPEATVRYLDEAGVKSTGEFDIRFEFLQKFAVKVGSS